MKPHLRDDALVFGEVAARAFTSAGGVELARRAELDSSLRTTEVAPLLRQLGADELDARDDLGSAEAAAALCREAGRVVLPYPVVPLVLDHLTLRPRRSERRFVPLASSSTPVDHGDVFDEWRMTTLDGDAVRGSPDGTRLATRLGPFVAGVAGGEATPANRAEIALHLTLTGFVVAGGLTAALDLATGHVVERVQFDKPLSAFQAVQFQLADAHVAVATVDELVQFALWRCHVAPDEAIVDALAARLAALDSARTVMRIAQQLHGASGMCDEYDVSVIARHLQPALRMPFGADATADAMAEAVGVHGFAGLFEHGGAPA